ncbi:F-box protein 22 [Mactra antiquata]
MSCMYEDHKISVLLLNSVDVVEAILTPLNAKQLNKCSRVCKFWSRTVTRLKKKRKTKSWACLKADGEDYDFISNITTYFNTLYTEPHVVFMMFRSDMESIDSNTISKCVQELIPQSCKLIGIGCGGIVGTETSTNNIHEMEYTDAVSFLCLPKYDNVEFVTSDDIEDNFKREAQTFADILRSSAFSTHVLLTFFGDFTVPRIVGNNLYKSFPHCLIAGAYIESVVPNDEIYFPLLHLTAIMGDRLQVASVIIENDVKDAESTEERMKRLKQYGLNERNSFAFMFACLGRGEGLYGQCNVESSLFRRYFPQTPLIGLFGNGEIGYNHVSRQAGGDTGHLNKSPRMFHSFTTVFVLISVT